MKNSLQLRVGEQIVTYWIQKVVREKADFLESFSLCFDENQFSIKLCANYLQMKGKIEYQFGKSEEYKNGQGIEKVSFSIKPVGILSTMIKSNVISYLKALEPIVTIEKNIATVSLPSLLEKLNEQWKSIISEFELIQFELEKEFLLCTFLQKTLVNGE